MGLLENLNSNLKTAMKAGDKTKTSVLRMILSDVKYAQAEVGVGKTLSDDDVMKVIVSYHKKLTKSLADYPAGDQKAAIEGEIAIVEEFLPKRASEAEIKEFITNLLAKTSDRQFGGLMKEVMNHFGHAADGKVVSKILKDSLQ